MKQFFVPSSAPLLLHINSIRGTDFNFFKKIAIEYLWSVLLGLVVHLFEKRITDFKLGESENSVTGTNAVNIVFQTSLIFYTTLLQTIVINNSTTIN